MKNNFLKKTPMVQAVSAALMTLLIHTNAQAQAIAPADEQKANAGKDVDIATVVVTATRRSERLQDVPLAISVVKGSTLQNAGVKDITSLADVIPGLDYSKDVNAPGFRVRGIGSFVSTQYFTNAEAPVGVVVDGVVQGLGTSLSNMGDVDRVEVLKGPQGTQFGKNSAAGVINITTIRPTLEELSGEIYGSYGNRNTKEARAAINIPMGTVAALRISTFGSGYGGYIHNVPSDRMIGGDKERGTSIKLFLKPTPALDFFLSADRSTMEVDAGVPTLVTINNLAPKNFAAPPGIQPGFDNLNNADLPYVIGQQAYTRSGVSLEANYRAGGYTLTSVTADRKLDKLSFGSGGNNIDGLPFGAIFVGDSRAKKTQQTQEFRVTSPDSSMYQYVAGYLFYKQPTLNREAGGYILPTPVSGHNWLVEPQNGVTQVDTTVKSNALFSDGKIKLNTQTAILLGLRYTQDKVVANFNNVIYDYSPLGAAYTVGGLANPPLLGAGAFKLPSTTDASASKLTYKVGAEHKISTDTMLFATYSTGYLGPVINYQFNGTATVLKPQTNGNITLGVKSQLLDHRLTVNADLYQDSYKNFQTGFFNNTTLQFVGENAAAGKTRGVEVDASYRITSNTTVSTNMAYVDATFGNYCSYQTAGSPLVTACTTPSGAVGGQLAGWAFANVPKYTWSVAASHSISVGDAYKVKLGGNYYYKAPTRTRTTDVKTETPGYGKLNLTASISPNSHAWDINFYARNVTNKIYPTINAGGSFYGNYVTPDNLRSFGASFNAYF